MAPDKIGSLIGAVGGLVFIQANAGAFPAGVELGLRVAGAVAFVAVLAALPRVNRPAPTDTRSPGALGRGYGVIVAAELLGIFVGLRVLNGPLDTPQATPAWIAFVVGTHFVALALLLREAAFSRLGYAITACGAAALLAAFLGAPDSVIAALAGILPGALLLSSVVRPGSQAPALA